MTCVRHRETFHARVAGAATVMASVMVVVALSAASIFETNSSLRAGAQSQTSILGDVMSLSDVVSGTYERKHEKKAAQPKSQKSTKPNFAARSGLTTTKQTVAPPAGLFGLFFGATPNAPLPVAPLQRTAPAAPVVQPAYTTVCVRLCDGAYFPVSYAATRSQFAQDQKSCESSCEAPSKLFVFETQTGSPDSMEDVRGNPYKELATAFKFRVAYDPSCKCRAHPWEREAEFRHSKYAEAHGPAGASTALPRSTASADTMLRPSDTPSDNGSVPARITSAPMDDDGHVSVVETSAIATAGTQEIYPQPTAKALSSVTTLGGPRVRSSQRASVKAVRLSKDPKTRALNSTGRMSLGAAKSIDLDFAPFPPKSTAGEVRTTTIDIFRSNFGQ